MSKREKTGLRDDAGKRKNLAAVDLYKDKNGKNKSGLELGGETHPDGNTDPNGARVNPDFKSIKINEKNQLYAPASEIPTATIGLSSSYIWTDTGSLSNFAPFDTVVYANGLTLDLSTPGQPIVPDDGYYLVSLHLDLRHNSDDLTTRVFVTKLDIANDLGDKFYFAWTPLPDGWDFSGAKNFGFQATISPQLTHILGGNIIAEVALAMSATGIGAGRTATLASPSSTMTIQKVG